MEVEVEHLTLVFTNGSCFLMRKSLEEVFYDKLILTRMTQVGLIL
jgi:hypothetical protein